ncbi:MAG: universal stress protein [Dictyoglomus sp.]
MKKNIYNWSENFLGEIQKGKYDLILMGQKGRSAINNLFLGSVSSTVINNCFDQTVAIINL